MSLSKLRIPYARMDTDSGLLSNLSEPHADPFLWHLLRTDLLNPIEFETPLVRERVWQLPMRPLPGMQMLQPSSR